MVVALIDDGDLVDRDIRDLFVLVTQVEDTFLHVDHIAAKGRIRAAGDVDLLAE